MTNDLQLMLLFVKIKYAYSMRRHIAVWLIKGLLNNMVSFFILRTLKLGGTILSRF